MHKRISANETIEHILTYVAHLKGIHFIFYWLQNTDKQPKNYASDMNYHIEKCLARHIYSAWMLNCMKMIVENAKKKTCLIYCFYIQATFNIKHEFTELESNQQTPKPALTPTLPVAYNTN